MRPTRIPASAAGGHKLAKAAATTIARYGLGLVALAATALFALLVLSSCGSSNQITSESLTLTTSGAPTNLVATLDDLAWNLDDNPFQPDWTIEEKEQWRRSLYLSTRFDVLRFFLSRRMVDDDDVFATLGQPPEADDPDEAHLQFFVEIHNHAAEIHVSPEKGQEPRTLSYWFRRLHPLAQSTYEQQERYRR